MTLPHVSAGEVARAAAQNDLIDTVNGHTTAIGDAGNIIGTHGAELDEYGSRITALESQPSGGSNAGAGYGSWIDINDKGGQSIDGKAGVKLTPWSVAQGTVTDCSMSGGTLTVARAGLWYVTATTQYTGSTSVRALWLSSSSAASGSGLAKVGSIAGPNMDVQTASGLFRLGAGGVVSAYGAIWAGTAINIYAALSNSLTAVWLGP